MPVDAWRAYRRWAPSERRLRADATQGPPRAPGAAGEVRGREQRPADVVAVGAHARPGFDVGHRDLLRRHVVGGRCAHVLRRGPSA